MPREASKKKSLRRVLALQLMMIVAAVAVLVMTLSFFMVGSGEARTARTTMDSDASYLLNQLESGFVGDSLMNGYDEVEHGLVVVAAGDGTIMMSNNPSFSKGSKVSKRFGASALGAIAQSQESGDAIKVIYPGDTQYPPNAPFGLGKGLLLAKSSGEYSVIVVEPYSMVYENFLTFFLWMSFTILLALLAMFWACYKLLKNIVIEHIDQENEVLARVANGDLEARATVEGTLEFEQLSTGINKAIEGMQGLIAEAETRMDAELETARAIQEAALPRTFPPFPDIMKFDIYATMNAARQIGGDFYDFFLIGDECDAFHGKLGFLVADVSGKGVPAALFMMKAKALLRDYMTSNLDLGEAVSETNRQLLEGNEEGVFVTAWVGVLDYGTGHVDYVNAGHNPPLLWQRDGGWRWLKKRSGPMLGNFDRSYRSYSVDCQPGDMFLLYTDGVTEAFDVQERMYGSERLLKVADKGYRLHPRELLESVRQDVSVFSIGAEQSDDITILTLEVGVPPEVTASLEVQADTMELERVNEFLHAELDRRFCPQRVQNKLDIAVEEFFTNVCWYAYEDAPPDVPRTVLVQRTYSADPPSITVDIIDRGKAFDPLAKPDAVTPKKIENVPIGGLGILMAKGSVDEISYERSDGRNILTIVKKW